MRCAAVAGALKRAGEGDSALRYEAAVIQAIRLKIREAIPRLKELRTLEPVDGNESNPFAGAMLRWRWRKWVIRERFGTPSQRWRSKMGWYER